MASIPASHSPIQCCAQGEKSINIKQIHGLLSVFSYALCTIIMRFKIKIQILEIFIFADKVRVANSFAIFYLNRIQY